ncbi:Hypothetical protein, putative [Bodo saltans]|uniref:Uncharacterized protein n=1 Tax=Bodo saltans TaxID=75058 RepID=A0A0S4JUV0_BODSA|nr:Hypothetical protein, putative [Bodo saltans]|eukprot:CUG93821.1 Hypothetical protein, putative [Bodo saltans]
MALGVLELVGGEEAIERQALERNEAVIFIPIVMLEATERSAVEVVQQNNAVWLEMMEKQRLADVNSDSSQLDDNEQLVSLFKDSNHNNRKGNSEDRHRPPPNLFLPRFALDSNDDEDRNNMSMTTTTPPSYSNSLESDQEVK